MAELLILEFEGVSEEDYRRVSAQLGIAGIRQSRSCGLKQL